ncbi:hypothetical protein D3C77_696700 [compost metagenome]
MHLPRAAGQDGGQHGVRQAIEDARLMVQRLLHIERRRELRRILEQGPDGLRLLGIEYRPEEVPECA